MSQIDTLPPFLPSFDSSAVAISDTEALCVYDSIFKPIEQAEPVLHRSLFTHHQLTVQNTHEINIHRQESPSWFFGFIILSIFLICVYLRSKQISITNLLQSAIDHRAMDRMLRDTNLTHALDQAPMALIALIPISLVCYYFFFPHNNVLRDMLQYLLLLITCYGIYFARNGIIRFFGNAFANSDTVHLYLSSNYIYHLLYGIAATAFAFFICYTDSVGKIFFYILAAIIGILFIFRVIRGMLLILTNAKTPKVYLFYYLCTFEIVPIIILTKVAMTL